MISQSIKTAATDAEEAVLKLTRDIVRGKLGPAAKLRVRELTERYAIGASPMREALARLSGSGLVTLQGQRGFTVAAVDAADLTDITRTRQIVEAEAFARAVESGDDLWEAEVVKSYHLLRRELERRVDSSEEWLDAFEARHHAFHAALISACPLPTLRAFCDNLYVRMERYRRLLWGYRFEQRDMAAEHENLMEAALSRNPNWARREIAPHIGLTADLLELLEVAGRQSERVATVLKDR